MTIIYRRLNERLITQMIIHKPSNVIKARKKLDSDVKDFLKKGGVIKYIPEGISGWDPTSKALRSLRINNKDAAIVPGSQVEQIQES